MTSESISKLETVDNDRAVCLSEKPVAIEAALTSETGYESDIPLAKICVPALLQHTEYLVIVAVVFIGVAALWHNGRCGPGLSVAISSAFSGVVVQLNNLSAAESAKPVVPRK